MSHSYIYTRQELRALIATSFPEIEITSLDAIGEGWDNIVALVNGALVFRFPRNSDDEARLEREIRLLSRLENFPAPVPGYRYISQGKPFFAGYSFIPGNRLDSASELSPGLLAHMVKVLQKLGTITTDTLMDTGLPEFTPGSWVVRQEKVVGRFEEQLSLFTEGNYFREIRDLLDSSLNRIPESSINLVHADMFRGNVIIAPSGDRIAGIIDWEDSFFGDMALDVAALGLDFGETGTRKLLEALHLSGEDPGIGDRVKFYQKIEILYLADHLVKNGETEQARRLISSADKPGKN